MGIWKILRVRVCVLACLGSLAGCAPSLPPAVLSQKIASTVPTCASEADCKVKWEAAQVWVSKATSNPVEIVTPVLIATRKDDGDLLSIRVTKERLDSVGHQIVFSGGCRNIWGCIPDAAESHYKFNLYVRSGGLMGDRQIDSLIKAEAKATPWPKDTSNSTRRREFDQWNRK
jgi:hypothetical protein